MHLVLHQVATETRSPAPPPPFFFFGKFFNVWFDIKGGGVGLGERRVEIVGSGVGGGGLAMAMAMAMAGTEVSSYPPLFREVEEGSIHGGVEGEEEAKVEVEADPLPVVDLECLEMERLVEVCREWGVFRLVNHGVPATLLTQLEDHAKRLFELPFESKQAIFTTPVSYFWGTPALNKSGVALSQTPHNVNWVEGFNVPLPQLPLLQTQDPVADSFRYPPLLLSLFSFLLFFLLLGWTLASDSPRTDKKCIPEDIPP